MHKYQQTTGIIYCAMVSHIHIVTTVGSKKLDNVSFRFLVMKHTLQHSQSAHLCKPQSKPARVTGVSEVSFQQEHQQNHTGTYKKPLHSNAHILKATRDPAHTCAHNTSSHHVETSHKWQPFSSFPFLQAIMQTPSVSTL